MEPYRQGLKIKALLNRDAIKKSQFHLAGLKWVCKRKALTFRVSGHFSKENRIWDLGHYIYYVVWVIGWLSRKAENKTGENLLWKTKKKEEI